MRRTDNNRHALYFHVGQNVRYNNVFQLLSAAKDLLVHVLDKLV